MRKDGFEVRQLQLQISVASECTVQWGFLLAPKTPVPRVAAYVRVRCEQAVSGGHEIVQWSLKVGLAEAETMGRRVRWGWGA